MRKLNQIAILVLMLVPAWGYAQYTLDASSSSLVVEGTSTLHDWEIEAEGMKGTASIDASGKLETVKSLSFTVVVDGLKSHKSGMDKNTYKALNEEKYPNITYTLTKVNGITDAGGGKYKVSTTGNLSIAGTTKSVNMDVVATVSGTSVKFEGNYPMKMTQFDIEPPTAMLGSIKTGDEVTVKYTVNYKK